LIPSLDVEGSATLDEPTAPPSAGDEVDHRGEPVSAR
jgi:hypothetical protein